MELEEKVDLALRGEMLGGSETMEGGQEVRDGARAIEGWEISVGVGGLTELRERAWRC